MSTAQLRRRLRRTALKGLKASGLEAPFRRALTRFSNSPGAVYDRQTGVIIERLLADGGSGVDVGAYRGEVLREIVAANPEGRHMAFEPTPESCAYLRTRFPGVDIRQAAVSAEPGEAEFGVIPERPARSGLREIPYPQDVTIEKVRVKVESLDNAVPEDLAVAFLKIDVEGGELDVLRGSRALIDRCQPVIVFELHAWAAEKFDAAPVDYHDLLSERHGYAMFTLTAWLAGDAPLDREGVARQAEHDFYFVASPRPA